MKTKKLKNHLVIFDAIDFQGIYYIWSLQHPIKEAKDSYIVDIFSNENKDNNFRKLFDIIKKLEDKISNLDSVTPDNDITILFSGTIEYEKERSFRFIKNIKKIDELRIIIK